MEICVNHGGKIQVNLKAKYSHYHEMRQDIIKTLGLQESDKSEFYLVFNGKILRDDKQVASLPFNPNNELDSNASFITVVPRVLGGKGGFGSMLRAIGAQIEKTTNRDACRDLSGRRLRDINEEQRLKKWFARQAEREQEKKEAKKRKLEKLKQFTEGPPLPKIDDKDYLQQRADMVESVFEAVDQGFSASTEAGPSAASNNVTPSTSVQASLTKLENETSVVCNESEAGCSKTTEAALPPKVNSSTEPKKMIKRTMLDEDLESCSSSDESSEEESTPIKKAKIQ